MQGQVSDIGGARALLLALSPPDDLIADKAYDADAFRVLLLKQGTRPVISPMSTRRAKLPLTPRPIASAT